MKLSTAGGGRSLALLLATVGLGAAAEAWRRLPLGTAGDPGPGVLPFVLGLTVAGLGITAALGGEWPAAAPLVLRRALAVGAIVAGWAVSMPYLGFALTAVPALFLLGRAIGGAGGGGLLLFALVTGGGASVLFRHVLMVPLPRGPWGW